MENIVTEDGFLSDTISIENGAIELRAQVDAMIEHWFVDMWLLVSDGELGDRQLPVMENNHSALAIAYQGQLHLLESKLAALRALRSVGILM
jgi:hypothetical protein